MDSNKQPCEEKLCGYSARDWMYALVDILNGNGSPLDIRDMTGLPTERCEEISEMYYEAIKVVG